MPTHNAKPRPSEKELERMYHEEQLTQKAIAEKVGVTQSTIQRWMRDAHIQRRQTLEEQRAERRKQRGHGNAKPRPSAAELRRMYHEEQLTQRQIAERVGCSYSTLKRWFDDYGIPRRASRWGTRQRAERREEKAEPALALPSQPTGAMEPDPAPFPTPGKRGTRKAVRPWQRLTSVERGIVAKNVDDFLIWVGKKREEEYA